jgi:DNA-binding transcriptional LysR family regulator
LDRLEAMQLFLRVVERRSFTLAASDSGIPRSTVTEAVQSLERRLGVRLLQRTTRTVRPTLDGEAYYQRCLSILNDIQEAEGAFSGAEPRGLLRIDVEGTLARHFLMPGLPDFFARYPKVELSMSESDRWVDPVREGVDCVLRFGALPDSGLVARKVATLERVTCATPSYLERFGVPAGIDSLDGHRAVGIRSMTTGSVRPLSFVVGEIARTVEIPTILSVTGPESYRLGLCLGMGIAQVPRFHVEDDLREGGLVELFPAFPPPSVPVSLLYPRSRQLSLRVRVFLDWAAQEFARRNRPSRAASMTRG